MKKNNKYKLILLLIVPIVISYIINLLISIGFNMDSSRLLSIATILLRFWAFVGMIYWFFVGKWFRNLEIPKVKSFILGNSLWFISLVFYIWQFLLLDDGQRNFFIAGISQHYPLGFVSISSTIIGVFTNRIDGNVVTMVSYLIMLIVFAIGFIYVPKNKYDEIDNQ